MEKDTEKTKVIFRKFSDGEIIALFPEIACNYNAYQMESYMRIGQHGAADTGIIYDTKLAKESEYADLFAELERLGYNLEVIQKHRYAHLQTRQKQIAEWLELDSKRNNGGK